MVKAPMADAMTSTIPLQTKSATFSRRLIRRREPWKQILQRLGFWLLLCCLLSCSGIGAQNVTKIGDGGFVSNDPCGPPCLWGITPQVTKVDQVTEILKGKGMPPPCTTFENETNSGWRGFSCPVPGLDITVGQGTGLVEVIGFKPSTRITVGDAIAKYGEPDAVSIAGIGVPEHPKVALLLYYTQIRTMLGLQPQEGGVYVVRDSTEIQAINYFDKQSYGNETKDSKWNGYGSYHQGD